MVPAHQSRGLVACSGTLWLEFSFRALQPSGAGGHGRRSCKPRGPIKGEPSIPGQERLQKHGGIVSAVNPANWVRRLRYPNHLLLAVPWLVFFGLVASGYLLLSLLVAGLYVLDPQGIARVDGTATSFGDLFLQPPYLGIDRLGGIVPDKPLQQSAHHRRVLAGVVRDRVGYGSGLQPFFPSTARILFSQEASAVHTYNGLPTLMSRLANERRKAIDERSAEGQRICRLLRDHFAAPIIVDVYPPRACRRLCRHLFTGAGFHSA